VQKEEWNKAYLQPPKLKFNILRWWEIERDTKNRESWEFKNKWYNKTILHLLLRRLLNKELIPIYQIRLVCLNLMVKMRLLCTNSQDLICVILGNQKLNKSKFDLVYLKII